MKNCFEYKNEGGQSLTFSLDLAALVVATVTLCVLAAVLGLCFAALHGRALEFAALGTPPTTLVIWLAKRFWWARRGP
jgi:hypothetical protein